MSDLEFGVNDVEAIVHSTSPRWTTKKKIDELLRIAASVIANTGIDSTEAELHEARFIDSHIYEFVLELEKQLADE